MNRLIIHGGGNDFAGSVGREYEERLQNVSKMREMRR